MRQKEIRILSVIIFIWAFFLVLDISPALRGAPGWYWPYALIPDPLRLVPLLVIIAIYLLLCRSLFSSDKPILIDIVTVIGSVLITVMVIAVKSDNPVYELFVRTVSTMSNGWHYGSHFFFEYGVSETLKTWISLVTSHSSISSHLSISPPGLPFIYYGIGRILSYFPHVSETLSGPLLFWQCQNPNINSLAPYELASAWFGILMPLWGSLCSPLFIRIGKLLGNQKAGIIAAVLWPLIPSLSLFSPYPTSLHALLFTLVLYFLVRGSIRASRLSVFIAGLINSLLLFITLSSLPILGFSSLFLALSAFKKQDSRQWLKTAIVNILFYMAGVFSIWIVFTIVTGQPFWVMLDLFRNHTVMEYPYWPWVIYHLFDFVVFIGFPLAFLLIRVPLEFMKNKKKLEEVSLMQIAGLSMLLILILVDVIGIMRGETGRIWLLFVPPLLMMIAGSIQEKDMVPIAIFQIACLVVLISSLDVMGSELVPPPANAPENSEELPQGFIQNGSIFDEALILQQFSGEVERTTGRAYIQIWLDWSVIDRVNKVLYISLTPVSASGQIAENRLISPFESEYPTTCWAGSVLEYEEIDIPEELSGEEWWISLSLWDIATGESVGIQLPDGAIAEQFGIGPFLPSQ